MLREIARIRRGRGKRFARSIPILRCDGYTSSHSTFLIKRGTGSGSSRGFSIGPPCRSRTEKSDESKRGGIYRSGNMHNQFVTGSDVRNGNGVLL